MPLNPSGAISLGGPVAGQSIAVELGLSPTATISLNDTAVRTLAQVPSGAIIMPTNFYGKSTGVQRAIFGFGRLNGLALTSQINLVSNTGVVATDTTTVATARREVAAAGYGGDKAIFGFGTIAPGAASTNITNLVSNTGVVAANSPGVGTARFGLAATGYGSSGQALFGYGAIYPALASQSMTNLVSNTGVVSTDTAGVGTARRYLSAARYGGDKALFGFGIGVPASTVTGVTNLVSNTGVVASDTPGVGQARQGLAAAAYGGDKAIFGFGFSPTVTPAAARNLNVTNLVSNTGVVAANTPGVGQTRYSLGAAGYGGDKAIFGFGARTTPADDNFFSLTNLVSNTGVVAADTPGVGTAKDNLAAASYSLT